MDISNDIIMKIHNTIKNDCRFISVKSPNKIVQ
jgi:hypothetical protein